MPSDLCPTCGAYWECGCPLVHDFILIDEATEMTPEMYEAARKRFVPEMWAGKLVDLNGLPV